MEMPVIAYYDDGGNIIGTDFAGNGAVEFGRGGSRMFMSYTGGTLFQKIKDEGGSVRAYFWSADGKPIAKEIDITNVF
ncbi:MAG: hypothetical protein IKV88_06145 [Clostridia bacterium]|nr:hypothetical protein [Clostridia bacterium]